MHACMHAVKSDDDIDLSFQLATSAEPTAEFVQLVDLASSVKKLQENSGKDFFEKKLWEF